MSGTLLPLYLLMSALFGGVLFQDDFNDGNADGWHEVSMVSYDVVEGMYRMYGGYEENHGIAFNGDDDGYMSTPDHSASCRIIPETGVFFGMMCRFSEDTDYRIMLVLSHLHQQLRLYRWGAFGLDLVGSAPFTVELYEEYWLRYEVQGSSFRGRAWTGGASAEPQDWMIDAQDTLSIAGSVALFVAGLPYDRVSLSCRFDDVVVSEPPLPAEASTWAFIKASLQ